MTSRTKALIVGGALAVAAVAVSTTLVSVPPVDLAPGESVTVTCSTELTGAIEPNQAVLQCAPEATPTPTPPPPVNPCVGTQVGAGENLHTIIDGKGGTFCLAAGTYSLGATPLKPGAGARVIGVTGTVGPNGEISAPSKIVGTASLAVIQGASNQTFRWLDVSGSQPGPTCQPDCGRGIKPGADTLIEYVRVHGNSNQGISSSLNFTVRFSEIDTNGSTGFKGTYGGIKGAASNSSTTMTVTNSYVHDNIGNGIWGDRCENRMVVTDNLVTGNSRDGIKWETNMVPSGCSNNTTRSASILRNVTKNNGETGDAGIKIRNSPNADVGFNTTGGNPVGILIKYDGTHGSIAGNVIHDNTTPDGIQGCSTPGVSC